MSCWLTRTVFASLLAAGSGLSSLSPLSQLAGDNFPNNPVFFFSSLLVAEAEFALLDVSGEVFVVVTATVLPVAMPEAGFSATVACLLSFSSLSPFSQLPDESLPKNPLFSFVPASAATGLAEISVFGCIACAVAVDVLASATSLCGLSAPAFRLSSWLRPNQFFDENLLRSPIKDDFFSLATGTLTCAMAGAGAGALAVAGLPIAALDE